VPVRTVHARRRRRWNRGLWFAFAVVLSTQLWPLRELGNRIEPSLAGVPFTVLWHGVAVGAWIAIYLLWMIKVWTPAADDLAGQDLGTDGPHEGR
jgi:hypothetical protein